MDRSDIRPFERFPSFEGIVAAAIGDGGTQATRFAQAARDAGADGIPDLDGAYAESVGVAAEVVEANHDAANNTTGSQLADTTDGAEAYRAGVLPHLPQPSAPIEGDYTEPPHVPADPGGHGPDTTEVPAP